MESSKTTYHKRGRYKNAHRWSRRLLTYQREWIVLTTFFLITLPMHMWHRRVNFGKSYGRDFATLLIHPFLFFVAYFIGRCHLVRAYVNIKRCVGCVGNYLIVCVYRLYGEESGLYGESTYKVKHAWTVKYAYTVKDAWMVKCAYDVKMRIR